MNCRRCDSDYTRMAGIQRFKRDYGYCSMDCLIADKPPCPTCGAAVVPSVGERLAAFARRSYCTQRCAAIHVGTQRSAVLDEWHYSGPRSDETRQRLRDAWHCQSPEQRQERNQKRIEGQRRWRQTPEGIKATTDDYARLMRERGHYQASSERMKTFYQTPEGQARKERMSQAYKGVPRPVRVTQRVRESVIRFWNTPEGWALRERLSEQRTDGLPDAPYGPGWSKQAAKARARDSSCVLCQATRKTNGRVLDVHHIHARRKFGYVPGQNDNYRWANHLANLITLCQSCHIRVEMKGVSVPLDYQQRADDLWVLFTA